MYYLTDIKQSEYIYILKAYATAMPVALTISLLTLLIFPNAENVDLDLATLSDFVFVVFVAPMLETLAMIPILALIKIFIKKTVWIALVSALIWASFHSASVPKWGLVVFFSFFIFSISFLSWEKKSITKAIFVTFGIHASINATAFIVSFVAD